MLRSLPMVQPSGVVALLAVVGLLTGRLDLDFETILTIGVVVAAVRIVETAWDTWRGRASSRWPTAPGVITEARLTSGKRPRPEVRYEYEVNGEHYEGQRVQFAPSGPAGGMLGWFRRHPVLDRYPVGTQVDIAYDPRAPRHAVLEPGGDLSGIAPAVIGLVGALAVMSQLGGELPFGITIGSGGPEQMGQPPAIATSAAMDPAVRQATQECRPPTAVLTGMGRKSATPAAAVPITCVVGYVSATDRTTIGSVIYLDDLGGAPSIDGVAVVVMLADLPERGDVVRAWGMLQPADEFPCSQAREACLLVTPMQVQVIHSDEPTQEPDTFGHRSLAH